MANLFSSWSRWRAPLALAATLCAAAAPAGATQGLGAQALRQHHVTVTPQLVNNQFQRPIVLQSTEISRRIDGDVYAVLDHPFAQVSAALSDPGRWCDILILHLNTKYCRKSGEGAAVEIELRVGKKQEQSVRSASLLKFNWTPPVARPDYLQALMQAPDGPFDTRDYTLLVEAVPLEGGRTFMHMGYAFSYSGASHWAMQLYLATIGRDKVGFTITAPAKPGEEPAYVDGMRGVVERNTMRYYLAIDAYLGALAAAPEQQLEKRLQAWFDATEKYPRQLHEVGRDEYLVMKRNEYRRQVAQP